MGWGRGPAHSTVSRAVGVSDPRVATSTATALGRRGPAGPGATGQPQPCQGLGADLPPLVPPPPQGPHRVLGSLSPGNSGDLRPRAQLTPSPPRVTHAPRGEGGGARQGDRLRGSDRTKEIKPSSAESSQGGNTGAEEDASPRVTAWTPAPGCQAGAGGTPVMAHAPLHPPPSSAPPLVPHALGHPALSMLSRNGGDGGEGGVWVREAKQGVQSQPLGQGAMEAKRGPESWAHSSHPGAGGQSSPEQG